ncbi:MAG: hypothetical protein COV70_02350 [Parcubacteria group bacterium CG11_big_fil_rev_8_21_14_0_20_39_22]|nr:MAG: hypothetical protein COV70_02350 [Parcubacteria group bacterium CG11_big_fil_rev_8_21_14_0_20_39_22]
MTKNLRIKKGYGDFGNLSKNYDKARKEFPSEAMNYILHKIAKEEPYILDIGCGTGIATEQLSENGAKVVGTDIDDQMIRQAKADNKYKIKYKVAPVEKQPFEDGTFDAITAFSSFHWFANKIALDEIRRVLKPNGWFFVINKNEAGDFKKRNKEILKRFINQEIPDIKKEYDPAKVVNENGFCSAQDQSFFVIEYFSPEEAIWYIQTMSVWNMVADEKKEDAITDLKKHFENIIKEGRVERQLEIKVVGARRAQ